MRDRSFFKKIENMITRKYYLKTKSRKSIHCEIDVNKIENEK